MKKCIKISFSFMVVIAMSAQLKAMQPVGDYTSPERLKRIKRSTTPALVTPTTPQKTSSAQTHTFSPVTKINFEHADKKISFAHITERCEQLKNRIQAIFSYSNHPSSLKKTTPTETLDDDDDDEVTEAMLDVSADSIVELLNDCITLNIEVTLIDPKKSGQSATSQQTALPADITLLVQRGLKAIQMYLTEALDAVANDEAPSKKRLNELFIESLIVCNSLIRELNNFTGLVGLISTNESQTRCVTPPSSLHRCPKIYS